LIPPQYQDETAKLLQTNSDGQEADKELVTILKEQGFLVPDGTDEYRRLRYLQSHAFTLLLLALVMPCL
jgi:hypothetical protein